MRLLVSHGVRSAGMRYEFQEAAANGQGAARNQIGMIEQRGFLGVLGQHVGGDPS